MVQFLDFQGLQYIVFFSTFPVHFLGTIANYSSFRCFAANFSFVIFSLFFRAMAQYLVLAFSFPLFWPFPAHRVIVLFISVCSRPFQFSVAITFICFHVFRPFQFRHITAQVLVVIAHYLCFGLFSPFALVLFRPFQAIT